MGLIIGLIAGYIVSFGLLKLGVGERFSAFMFWPTFLGVGFWSSVCSPWAKEAQQREEERRRQQALREEERREEERRERERNERIERERREREKEEAERREQERMQNQKQFLRCMFSMLAKLAKADGRVDREEVEVMKKVFSRFKFAERWRGFCADVFRSAKDDNRSIYWYAEQFDRQAANSEVCLFLYEVLWDVACADGSLHPAEKDILLRICPYLHISESYYHINYRRRSGSFKEGDKHASSRSSDRTQANARQNRDWRRTYVSGKSSILEAYEILECVSTDSIDALRAAYRKVAKRYHPDLLRANGVPDEMIAEATSRMAQVNAAWEDIRQVRNIS